MRNKDGSVVEKGDTVQCLYCMGTAQLAANDVLSDHWSPSGAYCAMSRSIARPDFVVAAPHARRQSHREPTSEDLEQGVKVLPVFYVEERRVVPVGAVSKEAALRKFSMMSVDERRAWSVDAHHSVRTEDEVLAESTKK